MHVSATTHTSLPTAPSASNTGRRAFSLSTVLSRLLSFPAVLTACILGLILVAIPNSMADPDIWWHLRNADQLWQSHSFLRADLYSFTAHNSPWIDFEWLSELPYYLGWRVGGSNGVFCIMALLIESIFLGVLWLTYRASRSLYTATVVTVAAAFLSTVSFGPRTLLFGWLCLVVELIVLELFATHPNAVFALPLLFALWINLHGSWLIGLVVFCTFAITAHIRLPAHSLTRNTFSAHQTGRLALAAAGILPALFCNPYGWRLVAYPFDLVFRQKLMVASIQEWRTLDLHSVRGEIVLVAIVLLVGRQLWKPRDWALSELALLLLGFYSGFSYSRFLFLLALLGAPIIARSFPRQSQGPLLPHTEPVHRVALNAALLLVVAVLTWTQLHRPHHDAAMNQFPAAALPAMAHLHPHGRVFNEFLWGGYMEWYLRDIPVFVDSRVDIFEYNGTFKDYLDIIHITDTLALLNRYRIDYVFFEKQTPLVYLLRHTGGWQVDYEDTDTILLERTKPWN